MAKSREITWELAAHTRAKHEILRRYLQAWVPILSLGGFPKFCYVDGFAGPGIYQGGEPGSPIIALQAARDQAMPITAQIDFLFVEKTTKRAKVLEEEIADLEPTLPTNFRPEVKNETFETAFGQVLSSHKSRGERLPPTFAFIDPFGWDVPFWMVVEIMRHRSCEVLVTFMYDEINRFISLPDQEANFDKFFGCPDWREGIALSDPAIRNRFLHDLYLRQLRDAAKAAYVRSFQMRNERDVTDYYLFFATNNLRGLAKMKEAMWKVDESGEFMFSDATDSNQLILFEKKPRPEVLKQQILRRFGGSVASVGEIERFVLAETAFRETHYNRQILRPMERSDPPQLKVVGPPRGRRVGSFKDKDLRVRFITPT